MRILTISDIHGQYDTFNLEQLPEVDVVLVAGDLTNFGLCPPLTYQLQAEREREQARAWFEMISSSRLRKTSAIKASPWKTMARVSACEVFR